jgi:hypothetical protein
MEPIPVRDRLICSHLVYRRLGTENMSKKGRGQQAEGTSNAYSYGERYANDMEPTTLACVRLLSQE